MGVSPEDILLAYGPLGLGVLALGWVVMFLYKRMIGSMEAELQDLRSQRNEMIATLLKLVPLMEQSNRIHEKRQAADIESSQHLVENRQVLGEVKEILRDVRRLLT